MSFFTITVSVMEIPFNTATSPFCVLILTLHIVTATDNGVLLKDSEYQKITSNTLKWITPSKPGSIPPDTVVGSVEYIPPSKPRSARYLI